MNFQLIRQKSLLTKRLNLSLNPLLYGDVDELNFALGFMVGVRVSEQFQIVGKIIPHISRIENRKPIWATGFLFRTNNHTFSVRLSNSIESFIRTAIGAGDNSPRI